MQIRRLEPTRREDVARWVDFPFRLYRDCSCWVPPLIGDARAVLDARRHPFYEHSDADFFVAEQGDEVVGRVAMLENRSYNRYRGSRTAFFGYFEAVDDEQVVRRLLHAGLEWAHARGLTDVLGPRGVIGVDGSVLVDGFDHRPALGIPYNFPYYDRLIRAAGFAKDADYLSGYLSADTDGRPVLPQRVHQIARRVREKRGYWLKQFRSRRELRRWLPRLLTLHREAFQSTRTFYPPTEKETARVINTLLTIADLRLLKLVMKGEEIAGFILAYQDVSAGLQRARGRLWPLGWRHILHERRSTAWLNVNGVGLLPRFQGLGGNAVLYAALDHTIVAEPQFKHVEVVQIGEHNRNSFSDMESLGVDWYKRHRHYRRDV